MLTAFLALLPLVTLVSGSQFSFGIPPLGSAPQYEQNAFVPLGDLGALSTDGFTRLEHPAFPRHSVRVKESRFCDESVKAYTGYIDVEARHLFFYFFESRRDPDTDDVVFWTNGGPGGSSVFGLFMELGPCRVTGPNSTEPWPYSWNENANIFFIDQPVAVGFSYAEYGELVSTTPDAAKDVAAFVAIFFEHFTKFKGRPFHMAGESYGGQYIPLFAAEVYDQNTRLIEAGMAPVNLTSVMIGNGLTNYYLMLRGYYEYLCHETGYVHTPSVAQCVKMQQMLPRCEKRYHESCINVFDRIGCEAAVDFCEAAITSHFNNFAFNPYDRTRPCVGSKDMTDCYPILKDITAFLAQPSTQRTLGVDKAAGNGSLINMELNARFGAALDLFASHAELHLAQLLERGVRALIYVGDNDWICNWIGNERMTLALEWSGQDAFRAEPLREWKVGGEVAGKTRRAGGLTFATLRGAGHMAPYDQPESSLELANRWLAGRDL